MATSALFLTPPFPAATPAAAVRFQAGGTVRESSLYIPREADEELFEGLRNGEFCSVLAPRQIGKSSLRLRTQKRLAAEGVRCIEIDLGEPGSRVTEETWYFSLAWMLATEADAPVDLDAFWQKHKALSPVHRWSRFLRDELLERTPGKIAIFIDEIDVVLTLPFPADDFFASIRDVYNARADDPAYERLTFCLLGLAEPSQLMKNTARTPFNIGRSVALDDFTREEASALLPDLKSAGGESEALLDEIFGWTNGHPYMTQRIGAELVRRSGDVGVPAKERVQRIVDKAFLERGRIDDANLHYAERYLAKGNTSAPVTDMLFLYRRLLEGEAVESDPNSPVELHLRLSGMAAARPVGEGRRLQVRNLIFADVFDLDWVKNKETELFLGEPLRRWLAAAPEARDDFVLRGKALSDALAWVEKRSDVSKQEEAFLRACQEVALREIEKERKAALERREKWILALILGILSALLTTSLWHLRTKQRELGTISAQYDALLARSENVSAELHRTSKEMAQAAEVAEKNYQRALTEKGQDPEELKKLLERAQRGADSSEQASILYSDGVAAARMNQWEKARALFLSAWRIQKNPQIAANLGQAEFKLGRMRDATDHLTFFLQETPQISAGDRRQIERMIAQAQAEEGNAAPADPGSPLKGF